ncbi:MAG: hypothetical protein L0Z53_05105 [Acidobacteriales bacterium]|nr:hypothetical protein [Terriglobales bacterium]
MFERLTDRARRAMAYANQQAQRLNHQFIGTEHILLGLLQEGSGVAVRVLQNLGADHNSVRNRVQLLVHAGPGSPSLGKVQTFNVKLEEARSEVLTILDELGQDADNYPVPMEPFQLPVKLSMNVLHRGSGMACLTDERGTEISLPMRIELATEIVKRYNRG